MATKEKVDTSWLEINIDAPPPPKVAADLRGAEVLREAVVMDIHKVFPTPPGEKGWKVAPRRKNDQDAHLELKRQISEAHTRGLGINGTGIWQPIIVRRTDDQDKFYITAGARRWRAAKEAGLSKIPVIVRDQATVDAYETALVENLLREDLTVADAGASLLSWMDEADLSIREMARRTGKSASAISTAIATTKDPALSAAIVDGKITPSQAREMLSAPAKARPKLVDSVATRRAAGEPVPLPQLRAEVKAEQEASTPGVTLRNSAETAAPPQLTIVPEFMPHQDLATAETYAVRALSTFQGMPEQQKYYAKQLSKHVAAVRACLDEMERVGTGEAVEAAA